MSWWTAITLLIKYLPVIVDAIERGADFVELRIELKKVDDALAKAKQTKDTSGLEKLLNPPSDGGTPPPSGNH